jgi:transketolase
VTKRVGVEAGIRLGWDKYITQGGKFVGVEKFGASAPYERILKEYGITVDHVLEVAKSLL